VVILVLVFAVAIQWRFHDMKPGFVASWGCSALEKGEWRAIRERLEIATNSVWWSKVVQLSSFDPGP
jgi:hypothetical protein